MKKFILVICFCQALSLSALMPELVDAITQNNVAAVTALKDSIQTLSPAEQADARALAQQVVSDAQEALKLNKSAWSNKLLAGCGALVGIAAAHELSRSSITLMHRIVNSALILAFSAGFDEGSTFHVLMFTGGLRALASVGLLGYVTYRGVKYYKQVAQENNDKEAVLADRYEHALQIRDYLYKVI